MARQHKTASRTRPARKSSRAGPSDAEALLSAAREDFVTFSKLIFPILHGKKPMKMNWHIHAIAHELELVRNGSRKRSIVSMPPRHLKSFLISVAYPAFLLGHDPSMSILVASYSSKLAIKHGDDFRAIVESAIYKKIFPGMKGGRKNSETEFTTTKGGGRLSISVEGPVTGRGCDLAIIDDPLTPDDATSDVRRQRVNDWFRHTLVSRLNDPETASIIVVMQRLHQNDLAGELLETDEWHSLKLAAIAPRDEQVPIDDDTFYQRREGDALHPDRMSLDHLVGLREMLGHDLWQAQYQQEPVAPGGNLIKRDWIKRYDTPPARRHDTVTVQSIDTAIKAGPNNDYSVITTWQVQQNEYYLVDVARGRLEYAELKDWIVTNAKRHSPTKILIEDAGSGTALIQELKRTSWTVVGVKPANDNLTRMHIASAKIRSGKVFLPQSASWLAELEAELFAFPQSPHDDQVDSISQFLNDESSTYNPAALVDFPELHPNSLFMHIMKYGYGR